MLLFSFVGLLLLRFAACRLLSLLLNDLPRRPRDEPLSLPNHPVYLIAVTGIALRDAIRSSGHAMRELWHASLRMSNADTRRGQRTHAAKTEAGIGKV